MMIDPKWYKSINVRISRRKYDKNRPIERSVKDHLYSVCASFRPFSGVRVVFVSEPPNDIFANALGFYGNIKNAPAFLAFLGNTSDRNMQEKLGYTGEGIILEATSLGLGTCWVALTYKTKSALSVLKLDKDEKLIAVSPVGYTLEEWTFQEKILSGFGANHRRKPLSTMVTGLKQPQRPDWEQAAVEAARLSPSAVNRQPWSFNLQQDSNTITVKGKGPEFNVSKRLDCGSAMLHAELGALSRGVRGTWKFLQQPDVARFKVVL
jgi:nitroreductase